MKPLVTICVAAGLLLAGIVISIGIGPVWIPPAEVLDNLLSSPAPGAESNAFLIIWRVRLPRIVLASLIGGGLAAAGAGYQGLFRNPLADPFIIGASSGAALGATLAIVSGAGSGFWGLGPIALCAMIGALAAVGVVYLIAATGGQAPTTTLLLSGVAVSSFIGAIVSLVMYLNAEQVTEIFGWLMGHVSRGGWKVVKTTLPIVATGVVALWLFSRGLDSLTFGEESAAALGLRLIALRGGVIVATSLATAGSVAAGGIIGFVGLVAPHVARTFVGPRHAVLIPASCLIGALLLLLADNVARTVVAPSELPVGIVMALLGGPFFLYLLRTQQRHLGLGQ